MRYAPWVGVAVALAVPAGAEAKSVPVKGHVLVPPLAGKRDVRVPVLLDSAPQRRLHTRSPLVYVITGRRATVSAPKPLARGQIRIKVAEIRQGDLVAGKVRASKRQLKRARKQASPAFRAGSLKVLKRSSALSNDELTTLIVNLWQQVALLSRRVDGVALDTAGQLRSLRGDMTDTRRRLAVVEAALVGLQNAMNALDLRLTARIDSLDADLTGVKTRLTAAEGTITSLLSRTTALESSVAALQTTVGQLDSRLATVEGSLSSLSSRLATVE